LIPSSEMIELACEGGLLKKMKIWSLMVVWWFTWERGEKMEEVFRFCFNNLVPISCMLIYRWKASWWGGVGEGLGAWERFKWVEGNFV
jgi:hypothetical protein